MLLIKPRELRIAIENTARVPDPMTVLGPRGINRRGDLVFGPLPLQTDIYMGLALKSKGP